MSPENPARYRLDDDDRLLIPRGVLPTWVQAADADVALFCVPVNWYRPVELNPGHELEAWCLWSPQASGDWIIAPSKVLQNAEHDSTYFALRTLMYAAKYTSKGRMSCAGLFNAMVRSSGGDKGFWVAPELNTVSFWTNASFQWSYGRLRPPY